MIEIIRSILEIYLENRPIIEQSKNKRLIFFSSLFWKFLVEENN